MQYQILQIETMSILWQTVGRIVNEILGVKVLLFLLLSSRCSVMITIVLIGFSDYFGFASLHSIGELSFVSATGLTCSFFTRKHNDEL